MPKRLQPEGNRLEPVSRAAPEQGTTSKEDPAGKADDGQV